MSEKTIEKLRGKYGVYEIKKKINVVFSDSYKIYKNGDLWKTASSIQAAYDKIKSYDSGVS